MLLKNKSNYFKTQFWYIQEGFKTYRSLQTANRYRIKTYDVYSLVYLLELYPVQQGWQTIAWGPNPVFVQSLSYGWFL